MSSPGRDPEPLQPCPEANAERNKQLAHCGSIWADSFENNAYLLFSTEFAPGNAFDVPDKSFYLFCSVFSLPGLVQNPLNHGLLLSLLDTLLSSRSRSKPIKRPLAYVFK